MLGSVWYKFTVTAFMILQVCSGNDIQNECVESCGTTAEAVQHFHPNVDNPSDEILCYEKCHFTKFGYLQEDGTVLVDEIIKNVKNANLPQEQVDEAEKCLNALPKIAEGKDMQLMLKCFEELTPNK